MSYSTGQVSSAPFLSTSLSSSAASPPRPDRGGVPSWLRLSVSNASSASARISRGPPTGDRDNRHDSNRLSVARLSFARHRSLLSDTSDDGPVGAVTRAVKELLPSTSRDAQTQELLPTVNPAAKADKRELFTSKGSNSFGSGGDARFGLQAILDGKTRTPVALFDLRAWLGRQPVGDPLTEAWSHGLDFLLAYRAYALKFVLLPPPIQAQSPEPFAIIEQLSRSRGAPRARARTLPTTPRPARPPPTTNPFATPFDDDQESMTVGGDFPVPVSPLSQLAAPTRPTSTAPSVALEGFEFVTPPQPVAATLPRARGRAASDAATRFLNPRVAGLANTLQPRGVVSFRDLPDARRSEQEKRATRTSYMTSSSFVTGITDTTVLPDTQPLRRELDTFMTLWVGTGKLEELGVDEDLVRRTKLEARYTTHPGVLRPAAERVLDALNEPGGMLDQFLSSGVRNITSRTATARLIWGSAALMLSLLITVLAMLDPSPLSHGWTDAVPRTIRLIALPFWFVGLAYLVSALTRLCPLLGIVNWRERGASARETMVKQIEAYESRRPTAAARRAKASNQQSRFSVFSSFSADERARMVPWGTRIKQAVGLATDTISVPLGERDPRLRWQVRRNLAIVVMGLGVLQGAALALPSVKSN